MPEQVRCAADKGLHFLLQQWLLNENYRHFLKARNEHFSPRHLTNETATLPPSPRSHFAGSPQQCSHSCPSKNDRTTTTTPAIIKRLRNGPTSSSTRPPPRSSTPVWLNGSARRTDRLEHCNHYQRPLWHDLGKQISSPPLLPTTTSAHD